MPFLWTDPSGETAARTDRIGQTHDIGAKILERAKIESAWGMQGRDLFDGEARAEAFIQYGHQKHMDEIGISPNIHTIRDTRLHLSVLQDVACGELYDLHADPGE